MKTLQELKARREVILAELGNFQGRELTAEESAQFRALKDEFDQNLREVASINADAASRENTPAKTNADLLREQMRELREGQRREITLATNIANSGAIVEKINPVIETRNEGLNLPAAVSVTNGVVGDEVWPTSINDADLQEVGENEELTDQGLDFGKVTPLVKRCGLPIPVSNAAIDEAAFDLEGFVGKKINTAKRRYVGRKVYSQAAWGEGNICGPFSGLTPKGTIVCDGADTAAKILEAVAEFTDKGLDPQADGLCIVIDAVTEAKLKVTPIVYGESAGMVISGGKLLGYDYIVSHYINTKLNTAKTKLVSTKDRFLGIGFFSFLSVQQHGTERLAIDSNSKAVALKNQTAFVLNTRYSITDLSKELRDADGNKIAAFALYKLSNVAGGSSSN